MKEIEVVATLYDPARRESIEVSVPVSDEYRDSQEFMWTEGNYSCDCNKRLFIARHLGEAEPADSPCGSSIVLEKLVVDGQVEHFQARPPSRGDA